MLQYNAKQKFIQGDVSSRVSMDIKIKIYLLLTNKCPNMLPCGGWTIHGQRTKCRPCVNQSNSRQSRRSKH